MKSSCQKEEPDNKKGYVFFSDPDVIVKRAESSAIAAQIRWDSEAQRQVPEKPSANLPASELGTKGLENFLSFYPVQPYPFTFISAIKQKLALGNHSDISAKPSDLNTQARNDLTSLPLVTNCKQKVYQVAEKMDLFRPLKVPDLKISPKTLDFSSRENSISRELSSSKSEIATKELAHDRPDKIKIGERVQRKLDFSLSDGPSTISCDNIEPLKVPNVSIASNLSKKKEHARDNSREKENRSKRIKKDDSLCVKKDETAQDQVKRSRSPRHVSRRDTIENMSGIIATKSKNDRLPFHTTKNNDSLSMKSKMKNFVTSTARKDNEKRQRTFNAQSVELTKDFPLESKGRIHGNKALDFVSWKIPDKVTTREISGSVAILSSNIENKFKDICHSRVEDLKYKCDSDNRQFLLKQDKPNITHKEQAKRVSDKSKISSNKIEGNIHNANSEPSEDIECLSETNSSKNRACIYPASSAQQSKSEDTEATMESKQNVNSNRSSKMLCSYTEHSPAQSTSENINKDEESYSQSVTTGQMTINDDSNNIDSVLPDELFDPRRISFRDSSYSQQDEFHNLATPDKIDFTSRVKQRRYLQSRDSEVDARCSKYKSTAKSEKEQEKIQLRHPEALRMTLQAECEFFESLNEACKSVKEVEKCLHNIKRDQKQKNPQIESEKDEEAQIGEIRVVAAVDNDAEKTAWKPSDYVKKDVTDIRKSHICDEALFIKDHYIPNQTSTDELSDNFKVKVVKVAEVQTQTVNDMATQTESYVDQCNAQNRSEIHESMCERSLLGENEIYQLLLNSTGEREDQYQIEEISLPSRITMSEISLHETTSSIKTETGNEISISTRDLKCSFKNKAFKELIHLDISQQIKDEKERYDKLEMLFKTREKNLNDKTKKLVKLEEQKRALKDTGQDSRISSVKKKQRALLLKLKEEQDEMNRLKELHEIASQERKLMLQKQKDMFNPQLSTKNILSKLKRSADSQSPRRLSGPMKGYDIRSNSSISSPYGFSDKSQHDRSQADARLQASESDAHLSRPDLGKSDRFENLAEESNTSATRFDDLAESNESHEESSAKLQRSDVRRYELKSRKYEEKMPKADILRQKQNQRDLESKRIHGHSMKMKRLMENQKPIDESQLQSRPELDTLSADHVKSESDTLVEELSKRSKPSQIVDPSVQTVTNSKEKELIINTMTANNESVEDDVNSNVQDIMSKAMKLSQISEDLLHAGSKNSKKTDKSITSDRDHANKKLQHGAELKTNSKRKNSKHLKTKSSSYALEKLVKHHDKRTKMDNESLQLDNNNESSILDELYLNDSQNSLHTLVRHSRDVKEKNMKLLSEVINNYESKSNQASNRRSENNERLPRNERTDQNAPTSRFSAFTISHQSSEESEKNLSVVLRSQNKDFKESKKLEQLEQILSAREAALVSRKNTVEEWMAWHTRLRTEEERVTRMEQATLKIAAATSNVLSQQDTTVSSDMSDVEGRIEMLTEKLAERRIEMSRLKREARRQTKQKLRAMEANLLNQIKRYDTTIHDMRKKLESKKAIKDSDKLAIEPKSLADFKVPEIPLKRIQDIYKSSDLLRSRSESDLLLTRVQQKDLLKIITHAAYYDSQERYNSQKSVRSVDSRSVNASELKSSTNRSDHSAFEDCTSTEARNKVQTVTSSSLSNDARTERRTVTALETDEKRSDESILDEWKRNNVSHDAEDVRTIASTMRSEQEVRTISDAKSEDYGGTINAESVNDGPISHAILDQSHSRTRSEIPEELTDVDHSRSVLSKSVHTVASSAHEALSFSEKLNFLQLNNKNLNENISSLENGLKVLSEMMSRFSDKPSEKPNRADEKSTSYDISEIKSVFSDRLVSVEDEGGKTVSFEEREIDSEPFSVLTTDRRSKSSNDLSHEKHTEKMNSDEISALIPDMAPGGLTSSVHEIDYEAKSKEIMNEIEKSILSENSKVARGDYNVSSVLENDMQNLHKGNEELLNDLISLELDIKSISEILSKVSESRKSLGLATNTASQIINGSKVDANELSDQHDADLEEETPAKDQTCALHSPKLSERSVFTISSHSPIIAGHRSKENSKSKSQRSAITSGSPRVLADESLKRSDNILEELHETETTAVGDARIETPNETKRDDVQRAAYDDTVNSTTLASNVEQNQSRVFSVDNASVDKDDWTTSDSFEVPQSEISTGEGRENSEAKDSKSRSDDINDATNNLSNMKDASRVESTTGREAEVNLTNVDVSAFIPKGESTNIDVRDVTFINTTTESHARKDDVLDDILSIIARESNREENIRDNKNEQLDNVISDSMADLLNQVEVIVAHNDKSIDSLKGILCDNAVDIPVDKRSIVEALSNETQTKINVEDISGNNIGNIDNYDKPNDEEKAADTSLRASSEVDEKSAININLHVEIDNEGSLREMISEAQEIIITELDSDSIEDHALPELEIDAKVELAEDEESVSAKSDAHENEKRYTLEKSGGVTPVEVQEFLEPILEQDSSDGEQMDNLVEVIESGLVTIEKIVTPLRASAETETVIDHEEVPVRVQKEAVDDMPEASQSKGSDKVTISARPVVDLNKTFDILKDPDYEDISEESLEVSEILDKNELSKTGVAKKSISLPDKYQATQKSDEVLRILDEISQKSSPDSTNNSPKDEKDALSAQSATEEISELIGVEVSAEDTSSPEVDKMKNKIGEEFYKGESKDQFLEEAISQERRSEEAENATDLVDEKSSGVSSRLDERLQDKSSQIIYELRERVSRLQEQDGSSESSEAGDTPRGVSEIEMDSPRDFNDSRLDIDILDDDLLSGTKTANQNVDVKTNFHSASIVATSEKDIEAMIYKLKASLEQPGLEVAELEAKLLRIEQLEIELEIKKLEAEEVSYYVREIPNKPPPPYTPPGDGRLSTSLGSPSLLTAVIPSNVDELTSFTEKAMAIIYNAKIAGEDIANLETPAEMHELAKEKNEIMRKDKRIYNNFLFDLCKEIVADVYRAEYEKPGPSWTKPNVKTKPTVKIPKTVEGLTEYVSKEVATLFGFKTKLQRENMVMRWSRKRRDRVDELLAREAQAEEDEWTKFHHDELAVKNGLTVAILDTLVMETVNVVKIAYGKKRRLMV